MNISQIKEVSFLVLPKKIIDVMREHGKNKIKEDALWTHEDILYGLARCLEYYSHLGLEKVAEAIVIKDMYKRTDAYIKFRYRSNGNEAITFFCRFEDMNYFRTISVRRNVRFCTKLLNKKRVKYPITIAEYKDNIYKYIDLSKRKLRNPFIYIKTETVLEQELIRALCTMMGEKFVSVVHPVGAYYLKNAVHDFVTTPKGLEVMDIIFGMELNDQEKKIHISNAKGLHGMLSYYSNDAIIHLNLASDMSESFSKSLLPIKILDEVE